MSARRVVKPKPRLAWAVAFNEYAAERYRHKICGLPTPTIFATRKDAQERCNRFLPRMLRIVRVEIREVSPRRKKGK